MAKIILLNKPFQVLCQFSHHEQKTTLKPFVPVKGFYPCGRLDYDSEGLLVLSDDGTLQSIIAHPKHKMEKTYWAQVEGSVAPTAIAQLEQGLELKDGKTRPARARIIAEPAGLWQRQPPIRERRHIPTTWIELTISEGKNRQVRRMTAATGHPTLRLIRTRVGPWQLNDLPPGQWRYADIGDELERKRKAFTNARGRRRRSF
ncbi:MAG: pseudouridine synthase [Gammaproteobacteria bacterium]|nr:MAG: pseudouridine synthase [Gammaproteobacteria bacterium]